MSVVVHLPRAVPPSAAPLAARDVVAGLDGLVYPARTLDARTSELRSRFGHAHVSLLSSGTAALAIVLRAMRRLRPDRDVVIVPAFCCFSVPSAVVAAGCRVLPVDVDPLTLNYDAASLKATLTSAQGALAVVVVHQFGLPADTATAVRHGHGAGAFVIDDAAQALGTTLSGAQGSCGTTGDAGVYSFGKGKVVTSCEGGAAVGGDERVCRAIAKEVALLPVVGGARQTMPLLVKTLLLAAFLPPQRYWIPASLPWLRLGESVFEPHVSVQRMGGMQAGLLKRWSLRAQAAASARQSNAAALLVAVRKLPGITVPNYPAPMPPLIRMSLYAADRAMRDHICALSRKRGLGLSLTYPATMASIPAQHLAGESRGCPGAEECIRRIFCAPTHPLVTARDRNAVVALLSELSRV